MGVNLFLLDVVVLGSFAFGHWLVADDRFEDLRDFRVCSEYEALVQFMMPNDLVSPERAVANHRLLHHHHLVLCKLGVILL